MKKSTMAMVVLVSSLLVSPVFALELSGVKVPEKSVSTDGVLLLNGAGVRKKMMFDVYVAALYVTAKTNDAAMILSAKTPRRMQLTLLREVQADSLFKALLDGLQANLTAAQLKGLDAQVAELEKIFKEIGSAAKGDEIVLEFVPGQGSKVMVRGKLLGVIQGDAFATALLSIWLGKAPVSDDLKQALLGRG